MSSMKVTRRSDRSLYMAVLQKVIRPFKRWLVPPKERIDGGSPQCEPSKAAEAACHIEEHKVEDIYIYDMASRSKPGKFLNGKDNVEASKSPVAVRGQHIYYICGGSFQMRPSPQHWKFCAGMATKLPHSRFSIISPPLAPENQAPGTFHVLQHLFRTLLRQAHEANEDVVFMGDSSGGNLVLSIVLQSLQDEVDGKGVFEYPPVAIAVISPAVDLTNENFEMQKIERNDPVLTVKFTGEVAETWRANWPGDDPRVSPINADHALLLRNDGIKVIAVTGGYDVLSPDALILLEKCTEVGVRGEWLHWERQMHCFPLAFSYGLRESKEGLEWMAERLEQLRAT